MKKTFHSKCQTLVNKLCGGNPYLSWPKEIKIAKKLLKEEPDLSFWLSLDTPPRLASLSWFLTEEGKLFLKAGKLKTDLVLPAIDNPSILNNKIGEDKQGTSSRPKSLLEFLREDEKDKA